MSWPWNKFTNTTIGDTTGWTSTNNINQSGIADNLEANKEYTYKLDIRDIAGNVSTSTTTITTLPYEAVSVDYQTTSSTINNKIEIKPNINTNTWTNNSTFTFENLDGFIEGQVDHFTYAWNTSDTYTFTGGEAIWSTGTLTLNAPEESSHIYLHLKPFNSANISSNIENSRNTIIGPFKYDHTSPLTPNNLYPEL